MSIYGINLKGNLEQQEFVRLIQETNKPIVLCKGNAGTGKTFIALAAALTLQEEKKYGKIIYARNPISVGRDMGSLPGGIEEKYDPFMAPVYDSLESIERLSRNRCNAKELRKHIEITPISFLRGRNFENTILIIDEAQNLDLNALKTVLTRAGKYCKIILLGSMNQIDDPYQRRQEKCDYLKVIEKLENESFVGTVELKKSMRSPICAILDGLLAEIE